MSLVYLNGKPLEHPHENHDHVTPMPVYWGVFVGLLVLTVLTYAVSYADLGPASLTVAMIVATCKASLVVAYFMHLKYEDRFYLFIFLTCLLFVGLFFFFTLFDVGASGNLNEVQRIDYLKTIESQN